MFVGRPAGGYPWSDVGPQVEDRHAEGMPGSAAAPCISLLSQAEAELDRQDSGAVGRAETKAAREAERSEAAAAVWAELERERREVDDRTARLRALRLARDATRVD